MTTVMTTVMTTAMSDTKLAQLNSPPLSFESFPAWAEQFIATLELQLIEREQGADYQQWLLAFEGSQVLLCFEHYAACVWLQPFSAADQEVAEWLTEQWNRP